jgi:hypothetical protein
MKRLTILISLDYNAEGGDAGLETTMRDPELRKLLIRSILREETGQNTLITWDLKEKKS